MQYQKCIKLELCVQDFEELDYNVSRKLVNIMLPHISCIQQTSSISRHIPPSSKSGFIVNDS